MKNTATALLSLLLTATANAQQPAAPVETPPSPAPSDAAPPAPSDAAPPAPSDVPPAPLPPPPLAEPAAPSLNERMSEVEGKVDGMNEQLLATSSTVSGLAKLKFSGYLQGRYELRNDSVSGLDAQGRVTNFDRFSVRRARLKATYAGENAEYVLQIDATGDGVALRDAEATFVDTWSPLGLRVTVGQFKVPFGYEVLQSSGDREMPERSRVIRGLFPGERDRGLRIVGRWEWLRLMAAAVNGNFTNDSVYTTFDQNRYADVYGRLGGDLGFFVFGLSGQFGEKLLTSLSQAARVSGTDSNGDGMITGDEITLTAATMQSIRRNSLWRVGADAQFYYDIEGLGGLALKGEVVLGGEKNLAYRGLAADPCRDVKQFGWILTLVQNFGDKVGVVARLDQYNPNRDVAAGTSMTCMDLATQAANDKITTLGGGLLLHISGNLKASAIYEHLWRDASLAASASRAPANWVPTDMFTLQLQAKY
jgi:hypothetical protein